MDRADNAEQDLERDDLRTPEDVQPSEPPSPMDRDLERLLSAIHEPAHL